MALKGSVRTLTLNLTTLHTLIRWRQAEPHPVLATAPTWYDEDTLRALDRHAHAELEANDRAWRGGPDDELAETVAAILRPDREWYGWISTTVEGRPFRYGLLAVAAYQEAALVIRNQDTDTVTLSTCRPAELPEVFLNHLPAVPPASDAPVSAPYQDFLASTQPEGDGFTGFGTLAGGPEVGELNEILARPRTGGGSLYTARRAGTLGTRRRCPHPVNYLDTVTGRWLTQLTTTAHGTLATVQPAGRDLIAAHLADADRHLGQGE
ncbi:ESX secretion-associated protein EspG [Actinophytocola xinjiangensis]|nr:ESX secretion-associated protein EspG [Actinophytocola xinjiangensis]